MASDLPFRILRSKQVRASARGTPEKGGSPAAEPGGRKGRFPLLYSNRNFLLLLGGRGISEFGDSFGELGLAWLVYLQTGSALGFGTLWLAFLIPRSAVRLLLGVHVDRFNKRSVMISTEVARALLFAVVGLAVLSGTAALALVYAVSLLTGLLGALFDLTSGALLPLVVEPGDLLRANASFSTVFQLDSFVGPAVAGIAIAVVGTAIPLLIDGASFAILAVALLLMSFRQPPRFDAGRSWLREFREGLDFFRARPELPWLSFLVSGVNFALGAFWYVYAVFFVGTVLGSGSTGYGLLNSFSALGVLATSVFFLKKSKLRRKRLSIVASLLLNGVFIAAISFTANLPEALVAIFGFGAAIPLLGIVTSTYFQRVVPKELLGRVIGLDDFFSYVSIPIGVVFGIFSMVAIGVANSILLSGLIIIAFGVLAILARPLRTLDAAFQD